MIFSLKKAQGHVFFVLIMVASFGESSYAIPSDLPKEQRLKMVTCPGTLNLDKNIVIDPISLESVDLTKERVVLVEAEEVKSVPIGAKEPDESMVWVKDGGRTGAHYHGYSESSFKQLAESHPEKLPDPTTRRDLRDTNKILISLPGGKSVEDLVESGEILENDAVKSFFSYIEKRAIYSPSPASVPPTPPTRVDLGLFFKGLAFSGAGVAVTVLGILVHGWQKAGHHHNGDDQTSSPFYPSPSVTRVPFNHYEFPGNWKRYCLRPFLMSNGTLRAFCSARTVDSVVKHLVAVQLENAPNCLDISRSIGPQGEIGLRCEIWRK